MQPLKILSGDIRATASLYLSCGAFVYVSTSARLGNLVALRSQHGRASNLRPLSISLRFFAFTHDVAMRL